MWALLFFGHEPIKFKTTETRFNLRGGPGSTFSCRRKACQLQKHSHTRNWRLNLFSKGTLMLITNPLENLKSELQRK